MVAWTYALAVNFVPSYTNTVDKIGESDVGTDRPSTKDEEAVVGSHAIDETVGEKHQALHVER
jgi:FHS family L-fucose permease-like MFS transporter